MLLLLLLPLPLALSLGGLGCCLVLLQAPGLLLLLQQLGHGCLSSGCTSQISHQHRSAKFWQRKFKI
jgi:hypothetical protein